MAETMYFSPREQEVLAKEFARQLGRVVYVEDMFPPQPDDFGGVREPRAPRPDVPKGHLQLILGGKQ